MQRPTISFTAVTVPVLLALVACSPKHDEQAALPAPVVTPANAPVAVAVQQEERKCNDDPRSGDDDKLPRCTGIAVVTPPAAHAYHVVGGSGDPVDEVVCDTDEKFVLDGNMFGVEFSGGVDGTYTFVRTPKIPGLSWKAGGRYHIEFPDGAGKPGTLTTEGGGTTTAGMQSRQTAGGEHFTLTPTEACHQ